MGLRPELMPEDQILCELMPKKYGLVPKVCDKNIVIFVHVSSR